MMAGMNDPAEDMMAEGGPADVIAKEPAHVVPTPDPRYPKYHDIENLARNNAVLSLGAALVVQEKLDGANSRFGLTEDGFFWAGSRNRVLDLTDDSAGYGFVGWLKAGRLEQQLRRIEELMRGYTFYGEWVSPKVQGRVKYPDGSTFYLFDVRDDTGYLVSVDGMYDLAYAFGLNSVATYYVGEKVIDEAWLIEHRDTHPLFGTAREGIVIKPDPPVRDYRGNWIMAKLKSPEFEEVTRKPRPPRDPNADAAAQAFVDTYINLERLRHVFAILREQGIDPTDIKSTGDVLRGMYADITKEAPEEFEALGKEQQKRVGQLAAKTTKPLIEQLLAAEQQEAA